MTVDGSKVEQNAVSSKDDQDGAQVSVCPNTGKVTAGFSKDVTITLGKYLIRLTLFAAVVLFLIWYWGPS